MTLKKKIYIIFFIFFISILYSFPNFYGEDPSIIINKNYFVNDNFILSVEKKLFDNNIKFNSISLEDNSNLVIRFFSTEDQFNAYDFLKRDGFSNLSLNILESKRMLLFKKVGIKPMKMGLDLRGGVYLLVKINVTSNIKNSLKLDVVKLVGFLKSKKISYKLIKIRNNNTVIIKFFSSVNSTDLNVLSYINLNFNVLLMEKKFIIFSLNKKTITNIRKDVVNQTIFIFNKRINELGISDSIVRKHGKKNIAIEIAGIQDIVRAKKILGKVATLKFMLVDPEMKSESYKVFYEKKNFDIFLKNEVILTGDSIVYASAGFENVFNKPCINIKVSSKDIKRFENLTRNNIGNLMAIVYKEIVINNNVEEVKEHIISVATIMNALSNEFQITGLNLQESKDLALLLRSGSLPASIFIIEEKLIGPTIGEENIKNGIIAIFMSLFFICIFMLLRYSFLGVLSILVLFMNVFLLIASMSLIGVTLTLPGLAGIAVTIGMSVDGNILVFERIREEIKGNKDLLSCIESSFNGAYSSIIDANLTTLIAGLVLFILGNGPVKGFAIVLSIGIVISIYSSIFVTKSLLNFMYLKRIKIL